MVEGGDVSPEVVKGAKEAVRWNDGVEGDVGLLDGVTGFTCKDDEFTEDVGTGEVDAWVGFGVTGFTCKANGMGEGGGLVEGVEDEVERTGEDSLEFEDAVAGVDEGVHGVDDGQPGADVGFEEELDVTFAGGVFEEAVVGEG